MWNCNDCTKKLGIKLPIIQAPMAGGATTPELVAAVSNAGGLGSLGAGYMPPEDMRLAIQKIRKLTDKPFAVNLFVPEKHKASDQQVSVMQEILMEECAPAGIKVEPAPLPAMLSFKDQIAVVIAEKVPVFSFTFGIPEDKYLQELRHNQIIIMGTATTLAEAQLLEAQGIDIVVAQGSEAGGHRGSFNGNAEDALIGSNILTLQLVDHLKIPVIAAGGIMDARGIVAALASGAAGVQMGTAFLTCTESGIAASYKQSLLDTSADNTALTRAFSGKMARAIKNQFISQMQAHQAEILDFPLQSFLTRPMRVVAEKQANTEFMFLLAGQGAYLCQRLSAVKLMEKLEQEVQDLLKKMCAN